MKNIKDKWVDDYINWLKKADIKEIAKETSKIKKAIYTPSIK